MTVCFCACAFSWCLKQKREKHVLVFVRVGSLLVVRASLHYDIIDYDIVLHNTTIQYYSSLWRHGGRARERERKH